MSLPAGSGQSQSKREGAVFSLPQRPTTSKPAHACGCGGLAAPITGSDGFGLRAAKAFGHRIVPTHPSLVPLTAKGKFLSQWAGVRARGRVSLYVDGHLECEDEGELQLTKDGISGIPVFQVSRFAAAALDRRNAWRQNWTSSRRKIWRNSRICWPCACFTRPKPDGGGRSFGLLNRKLHGCVCQAAGLHPTRELSALTDKDAGRLARAIKTFPVSVTGPEDTTLPRPRREASPRRN